MELPDVPRRDKVNFALYLDCWGLNSHLAEACERSRAESEAESVRRSEARGHPMTTRILRVRECFFAGGRPPPWRYEPKVSRR